MNENCVLGGIQNLKWKYYFLNLYIFESGLHADFFPLSF